jgi:hypothetical protein
MKSLCFDSHVWFLFFFFSIRFKVTPYFKSKVTLDTERDMLQGICGHIHIAILRAWQLNNKSLGDIHSLIHQVFNI